MKIKTLFLFILIFFSVHFLHANDSLFVVKQQISYQEAMYKGDNLIWDFSNADTIGEEYEALYFMPNKADSSKWSHIEYNTRYNYELQGDTLFLLSYENPTTYIKYSHPEALFSLPIKNHKSSTNQFVGTGEYGHLYPLNIMGSRTISIVANGILKLPNTTYNETFLLHSCRQYIQNGLDSVPIHLDIYQWFSPASNFPLLESIISIVNDTLDFNTSFVYKLPHEEEKKVNEYENQINKDSIITYLNCYPNPVETELFVNYSLSKKSDIIISLHNSLGLQVYQTPIEEKTEGEYTQLLNLSGLTLGVYTLYIHAGEEIIEEEIIKK